MSIIKEEIIIKCKDNKPITFDINYEQLAYKMPIIIFSHGFKGFKDWGTFNLMAEKFANNNLFFLKLNFSHKINIIYLQ